MGNPNPPKTWGKHNATEKTNKMGNTDPTKNLGYTQLNRENKQYGQHGFHQNQIFGGIRAAHIVSFLC
jgi:hypothetical protein